MMNYLNGTIPKIKPLPIKLLMLLPLVTGIQGCYSFSDVPEPINQDINTSIYAVEEDRVNADIEDLKNELAQMKPSINRLITLETELTELLDTIRQVDQIPALYTESNGPLSNQFSNTDAPSPYKFLSPNTTSSVKNTVDKFSQTSNNDVADKFSQVSVGKAQPLLNQNTAPKRIAALPLVKQLPINTDKFSSNEVTTFTSIESPNECPSISEGQGYAMHIASFKNKNSAEKLLQEAIVAINRNNICQRQPIIANVVVKGQTYFSARIGSFLSKADVSDACGKYRQYLSYCGVTQNIGSVL